jgi:hypothetical protein
MGRTIPSFRLASGEEEREWKIFRNTLDKSDRKICVTYLESSRCTVLSSSCHVVSKGVR